MEISIDKKEANTKDGKEEEPLLWSPNRSLVSNYSETQALPLDEILDRLSCGRYQIRLIIILGLGAIAEASQITVFTMCMATLQAQWKFNDNTRDFVISLNFIGLVIGSAISGYFSDTFGRRKPLLMAITLITILNFASAFALDIAFFGLIRLILCVFLGFFAPLAFVLLAENMPRHLRGRLIMITSTLLFVGQLIGCLIAYITIKDLNTGDWKGLIYGSTIVNGVVVILTFMYLDESVRYYFVSGEIEKGYTLLEKIMERNNIHHELTEKEKEGIEEWQGELEEEYPEEDTASVKALFQKGYKKLTAEVWFCFFVNSFVYYSAVYMLPIVLKKIDNDNNVTGVDERNNWVDEGNSTDLGSITISILFELISGLLAVLLMELKIVKKKTWMIILYVLAGIFSGVALIKLPKGVLVAWVTLIKIFTNVTGFFFSLYTIELYPTKYRTTGLGLAIAVGKIFNIFTSWVCSILIDIYLLAPFGLFAGLLFLAALTTSKIRMDFNKVLK